MTTSTEKYYAEERLLDGRALVIRAVHADDKPLFKEAMSHLSPQSIYFRFLTPKTELSDKELAFFTEVDFIHHVALMASVKHGDELVPAGVGRYIMADNSPPTSKAELAFVVSEEYRGLGIATLLLKHLTKIARSRKVEAFTALVLPTNTKMLSVFRHCELPMETTTDSAGGLEILLKLE